MNQTSVVSACMERLVVTINLIVVMLGIRSIAIATRSLNFLDQLVKQLNALLQMILVSSFDLGVVPIH